MSVAFIIALISLIVFIACFVVPVPDSVKKVSGAVFVIAAIIWSIMKYT